MDTGRDCFAAKAFCVAGERLRVGDFLLQKLSILSLSRPAQKSVVNLSESSVKGTNRIGGIQLAGHHLVFERLSASQIF